jgi:cyclophilin family peptidyl-prolyl cis-trans isomerase
MILVQALVTIASFSGSAAPAADVQVTWSAPKVFLEGVPYVAHVEITAPAEGGDLPAWGLTAAAFTLDGASLGERAEAKLELAPGQKITTDIDLTAWIAKKKSASAQSFKIGVAKELGASAPEVEVAIAKAAEAGLDFMTIDAAELPKFHVLIQTNRGDMEVELWPDVAPNVVRNFLDLAYTGFYKDVIFHRVLPGFMIQGGDPTGTGTGNGKRKLKDEFSTKKHERGVISMASSGPNTASCQFFIMHANYPSLDGKYSCFGKLVSGLDTVDKIANAPGTPIPGAGGNRPTEPQKILNMTVLRVAK